MRVGSRMGPARVDRVPQPRVGRRVPVVSQRGQASADLVPQPRVGRRVPVVSQRGQASVELVGLLPLLAAVALGVFQLLAAGAAREAAGGGAEAGAVALLQDRDPKAAVRAALPAWSRPRATIGVDGRRIRVRVRPRGPIPALARRLAATATAHAGPTPSDATP